jgi:hypothetical protein
MKRNIILMGCAMALALGTNAFADTVGDAVSHVRVTVDPNVAVDVLTATVNAGTVQVGDFSATVGFRVDANTQACKFQVRASNLFKGNDPASTVAPIPLVQTPGVTVNPTNANPTGGGSATLPINLPDGIVNGFPMFRTLFQEFESSQNNHFSQDVDVELTWNQPDPEKPMGEYSGEVQLLVMVSPL